MRSDYCVCMWKHSKYFLGQNQERFYSKPLEKNSIPNTRVHNEINRGKDKIQSFTIQMSSKSYIRRYFGWNKDLTGHFLQKFRASFGIYLAPIHRHHHFLVLLKMNRRLTFRVEFFKKIISMFLICKTELKHKAF